MSDRPSFLRRFGPSALAVLFGVSVIALVAHFLLTGDEAPKRRVNETVAIKLIPPPTPPPPKIERPPEPPKVVEQTPMREPDVKQDKPPDKPKEAPKPDEPPPGPLALDAKGEGPGDAFGLGGKPGGNGLLGGGGGGGGGGNGWYTGQVQTKIQQALAKDPTLAKLHWRLAFELWIDATGKVERVQLVTSTGVAENDDLIRRALLNVSTLDPPPKDITLPVVVGTSMVRQAG